MDTINGHIERITKQTVAMKEIITSFLFISIFAIGCDFGPKYRFEKHFLKNENLLEFKANVQDPFKEINGYEISGLKMKYDHDTIHVKFKFNSGMADVNQAIGFKGDTLMLYYHLWCETCVTEWMGFELKYKILNKHRKKYKIKPVRISSADLEEN